MLGEVVGVACVPKADGRGTPGPAPTLLQIRNGLPNVPLRFKPRVLVLMDAIPKGPTGKPKRIGLAQLLCIPAVGVEEEAMYQVGGVGDRLGPLMKLDPFVPIGGLPTDDAPLKATPVWTFPLTISLEVSDDLPPPERSVHTLVIRDSLCNEYELSVTTSGLPPSGKGEGGMGEGGKGEGGKGAEGTTRAWHVTRAEVQEVLGCVRERTHEYGLEWTAKIGDCSS